MSDVAMLLEELDDQERTILTLWLEGQHLKDIRASLEITEERFKGMWDDLRQVVVDTLGVIPDVAQVQRPFWRQS